MSPQEETSCRYIIVRENFSGQAGLESVSQLKIRNDDDNLELRFILRYCWSRGRYNQLPWGSRQLVPLADKTCPLSPLSEELQQVPETRNSVRPLQRSSRPRVYEPLLVRIKHVHLSLLFTYVNCVPFEPLLFVQSLDTPVISFQLMKRKFACVHCWNRTTLQGKGSSPRAPPCFPLWVIWQKAEN